MSESVHDVRNMKFEQRRQDIIDEWMQKLPIEELERKILKDYRGVILGWKEGLSGNFEMHMSLDGNALCAIVCTEKREVHGIIEYEAIVTWPRDKRKEYWQLEYRSNMNSVYGFDFMEVTSPAVAATHVTPDDDRYILATYFPRMQAGKDILSTSFQNENFPLHCRWEGKMLCSLHCSRKDISFPHVAPRGATVADDNHLRATTENLTVYNLTVKWGRHQPDESWTLSVSWKGHMPKTVHEFKYIGPKSRVTDVQQDLEHLRTFIDDAPIAVRVVSISQYYKTEEMTVNVEPSETVQTFVEKQGGDGNVVAKLGFGFLYLERPIKMIWVHPQETMQRVIQNFWPEKGDTEEYLIVSFSFTDAQYKRDLEQIQKAWLEIAAVKKWSGS